MLVRYTMLQVIGYLLSVAFKQSVLCIVCMYDWGIILWPILFPACTVGMISCRYSRGRYFSTSENSE